MLIISMTSIFQNNKSILRDSRGFTLIEVTLVLAIGGLIFLLAFIAYGQASVNRRDTQRRADLGKIASELENYAADNNGKYPVGTPFENLSNGNTEYAKFMQDYVGNLSDPNGDEYKRVLDASLPGFLTYEPTGDSGVTLCDGSNGVVRRDYKIKMLLEKGETCRDSSN